VRPHFATLVDRLALLLALITTLTVYLVSDRIYERMAHFEDEMAYVWQAQAIAGGDLVLPSPPNPIIFLVPFVIDYHGQRFGKYPPGWPTLLAFGFATGLEDWVNPLLAGLGIWLLYLLAKRITNGTTSTMLRAGSALLSILLMLTSPMFWMLSGSLLSHTWSLVLTSGFVLAWLDTFIHEKKDLAVRNPPVWITTSIAGICLGVLILARPMNAVGVALPFFIHGIVLLLRGDRSTRIRVVTIGLLALLVGSMYFAWQFAVTGDLFLNPYMLWWKYDKVGFGPGYGLLRGGHNLERAWYNLTHSLWAPDGTRGDVLGWENLWWIFIPFGLWALRKKPSAWLVAGIFPALVLVYIPYWIGSWQYGPRYYYEGMLGVSILSAAGVAWLAGNGLLIRKILAGLALMLLVGYNLFSYLPGRLWGMHGMYNINRAMLEPFLTEEAQRLTPALIVVHTRESWTEYGGLLELQNAQLTTPLIFAIYRNDSALEDYYDGFPDRTIYNYYPDEPFTIYQNPR